MKKTILISAFVGVVGIAQAIPNVNGLLACTNRPVWENVTGGGITNAQKTILCWNTQNKSTGTLYGRDNSVSNNCFTLGTFKWFNYAHDKNQSVTADIKFDTRFLKNGQEQGQTLSKIAFGANEVRSNRNNDDCAVFPAMGTLIGSGVVKGQAYNVVLDGVYNSAGKRVTQVCIPEGSNATFTFKACLQAVPEPGSLATIGAGALGFLAIRRKRK